MNICSFPLMCWSGVKRVHACSCVFMRVRACSCVFVLVHASSCLFMPVHACSCVSMLVHVCPCLSMCVHACPCLSMLVHACLCLFMLVHACSCLYICRSYLTQRALEEGNITLPDTFYLYDIRYAPHSPHHGKRIMGLALRFAVVTCLHAAYSRGRP